MKDSEFIELLNLYLDHEISAADAVRLEAEVQGNAARRRIYEDYCRMQKACKVLAHDFQTEAPGVPERKVIPFEPAADAPVRQPARAARASGFYTFGTLAAAAACVAVILVSRSSNQSAAGGLAQTPTPAAVQAVAASAPVPVQAEAVATTARPLVGSPLFLSGKAQSEALHVAATEEADARFAWMNSVQLAPIPTQPAPTDPLRFEIRQKPTENVYTSPQPLDVPVHQAAWRFVK
jgi:hypothetical protein